MTNGANRSSERKWIDELEHRESDRDYKTALILSILFGAFGADRFYLGYTGYGYWKLVTFGGFGVWWLTDIFLIASGKLRDADGYLIRKNS